MSVNDELGKRMKENYENRSKTYLIRRTPVAIRFDGKAFHTFTRGLKRPFDKILIQAMQATMKKLCENIQGCVFGYTQSDEITIILRDDQTLTTDAWFDYSVQKICSVGASMATYYFNKEFTKLAQEEILSWVGSYVPQSMDIQEEAHRYHKALKQAMENGALFDARCFNIPKEEVTNLIYWRQLDATRNSIQMVGQFYFSHSDLMNKSCNKIQDLLFEEYHVNWNDYLTYEKRGSACYKTDVGWFVDLDMPILKGEDREYVERWLY